MPDSRTVAALSISLDGYITGPDPGPGRPLGRGGEALFAWYGDGDTPSSVVPEVRLSPASAAVFDLVTARTAVVVAGRNTYDHFRGWDGGTAHPTASLVVVSRTAPPGLDPQDPHRSWAPTLAEALAQARAGAAERGGEVSLLGGALVTQALAAGEVDELTLHQVPVILGGGTPLFGADAAGAVLTLCNVVPAPGVTHLSFRTMPAPSPVS